MFMSHFCHTSVTHCFWGSMCDTIPVLSQRFLLLRTGKLFPPKRKNIFYAQEKYGGTKGLYPFWGSEPSLQTERPIPSAGAIVIL